MAKRIGCLNLALVPVPSSLPPLALHAGEGRDLLGQGVDFSDGVVTVICHIQGGAGDGQGHVIRLIELGVGAGPVVAPAAPSAGEGRDILGHGVDNADCVVLSICHVQGWCRR